MAFRAATKSDGVNINTLNINKPTGTAVGDVLVLGVNAKSNVDRVTPPSGFTVIGQKSSAGDTRLFTSYRVVDGTEGSTFTITTNANSNGTASAVSALLLAFSGRASSPVTPTPVSKANSYTSTNSATTTSDGLTAEAGSDLVFFVGAGNGGTYDHAPPANYTEPTPGEADNYSAGTFVAYRENVSAGSTGTITGTLSGDPSTKNTTYLIALAAPAAATTPPTILTPRVLQFAPGFAS